MVKFPLMDEALVTWIKNYQHVLPLSGDMIVEKARFFLKELYPGHAAGDMRFSNGWLDRFKERYQIKIHLRSGESASASKDSAEDAIPQLQRQLHEYELCNIFNMDETGLFFRQYKNRSLSTQPLEGWKLDKDRLSITICCNADRTERLPCWVIGKYANPRCFKNVNQSRLGVEYRSNGKVIVSLP